MIAMPECPQRTPAESPHDLPRSVVFAALAVCATFALTTATGAPQAAATSAAAAAAAAGPIALVPADQEAVAGKVAMLFLTRFHYRPRPLDATFSAVVSTSWSKRSTRNAATSPPPISRTSRHFVPRWARR